MKKLNLGCGHDKRPGFINIDANEMLEPDEVLNLEVFSLSGHFTENSVELIVANDIIEHLFRWEAMELMNEMYMVLIDGGTLEMRLPDFEAIVNNTEIGLESKIPLLFGGQDIPQGEPDPSHRRRYPEFYCHKFSYTRESMRRELEAVGFTVLSCETVGTNMEIKCVKGIMV